jgi:hypothetical protein
MPEPYCCADTEFLPQYFPEPSSLMPQLQDRSTSLTIATGNTLESLAGVSAESMVWGGSTFDTPAGVDLR